MINIEYITDYKKNNIHVMITGTYFRFFKKWKNIFRITHRIFINDVFKFVIKISLN